MARTTASNVSTERLPRYERPPVVEVASGVTFDQVDGLTALHWGGFWEQVRGDFPRCQEADPLVSLLERVAGEGAVALQPEVLPPPLSPRFVLLHKDDDQVIQLQKDRFIYNWRTGSNESAYPHFQAVNTEFVRYFAQLKELVASQLGVQLVPKQYELVYINHVIAPAWSGPGAVGGLLPDLNWRNSGERFLPVPEGAEVAFSFVLPGNFGRLHFRAYSGFRSDDRVPVLVMQLAARGFAPNETEWFTLAHEWIVKAFEDLTDETVQEKQWQKIQT